jgi:hypothetical protein
LPRARRPSAAAPASLLPRPRRKNRLAEIFSSPSYFPLPETARRGFLPSGVSATAWFPATIVHISIAAGVRPGAAGRTGPGESLTVVGQWLPRSPDGLALLWLTSASGSVPLCLRDCYSPAAQDCHSTGRREASPGARRRVMRAGRRPDKTRDNPGRVPRPPGRAAVPGTDDFEARTNSQRVAARRRPVRLSLNRPTIACKEPPAGPAVRARGRCGRARLQLSGSTRPGQDGPR